mmetsp:Transcript_1825/g.5745  ORF Transcript_1825/g.5745 Transcript_1825/m.5745 type:complete len:249 (+) Transcript_1825:1052-1798(+)
MALGIVPAQGLPHWPGYEGIPHKYEQETHLENGVGDIVVPMRHQVGAPIRRHPDDEQRQKPELIGDEGGGGQLKRRSADQVQEGDHPLLPPHEVDVREVRPAGVLGDDDADAKDPGKVEVAESPTAPALAGPLGVRPDALTFDRALRLVSVVRLQGVALFCCPFRLVVCPFKVRALGAVPTRAALVPPPRNDHNSQRAHCVHGDDKAAGEEREGVDVLPAPCPMVDQGQPMLDIGAALPSATLRLGVP